MLNGWRLTLSKCFLLPQRYILGIMGFFAIVNAYTMRVSLSLAITEMVIPINATEYYDPEACTPVGSNQTNSAIRDQSTLYDWDEKTQGLILSAFYWGYVLTHLPGGILAEKFGGKYSLGLGVLSTALFTLITPWVIIWTGGNWKVLVALRIIEGLGEGTTYPALTALLAKWVPLKERATIGSIVFSGSQFGTILSNALSGELIRRTKDWASVFYFFGALAILWFILWVLLCYSDPSSHPFISDKEKEYLEKELSNVSNVKLDVPWKSILTSVPMWALVITQVGHDWGFFTMITDLPKYMKDVLKFNVSQNGTWSSVPYIVMLLTSIMSGWFCDFLVRRNIMSLTFSRKFFTSVASIGPAVFIVIASYAGCDRMLAVWMFTIAMAFMGCYYCGMKVNALDLSPNFAGTLMAIINGLGATSGIVTPYLAGALTEDHTLAQWRLVFWITFGVFGVTNLVYLLFGTGKEQLWNNPEYNAEKPKQPFEENGKANIEMKTSMYSAVSILARTKFKSQSNNMPVGWRLTISKCCPIPQRYVLAIMGFLAVVNAYAMRVSLSIAITEMVKPSNSSSENNYEDLCAVGKTNSSHNNAVKNPDILYDWDEPTQGWILSAFYWGYLITHLPGGILAAKFGGKYTLGLGILSTGIFTILTPWIVIMTHGNWKWIVALRVVEGLGEGTTYPALNTMLAQWVPVGERSKIGSLVYAGGQIGTIVCNLISGQLITATEDWASVFYLFGGLGIVWFIFFQLLCYSEPKHHPFISDREKQYLEKEIQCVSDKTPPIPWKALASSVPLWALIAAQIGHDWGFYTMVSDLPKYMKEVLRFDVATNGLWNSIPYAAMWIVSISGGWICDWLISHRYMSITVARRFFTAFAAVGPAIFIMAASYAECNTTLAAWMFTTAMGFMGTFYCGMKVNALDLSPNFAGIIMAITNGIGAGAGIITPYLTGALTGEHTVIEWRTVFWISFVIFAVTSVIYSLFGSGEEQWWNNPEKIDKNTTVINLDTKQFQRKEDRKTITSL
uniref:Major facilitator superfamily (MFS) profile domain-containing protein n=2 Tax=Dendroctonus ponderosae TaxID=77166 RepID=A0AAR5QA61_DENPD